MKKGFSLVVACVAISSQAAAAQEPVVAQPGARLRLTIASGHQRMHGQFVRPRTDSLEFAWSDSRGDRLQQLIALRDIANIEISNVRTHPYLDTGLKGALMGLGFGVISGLIVGCADAGCTSKSESAKNYGLIMGAVGLTIGVVRAAEGFDRWMPATVPGWSP